VANTADEYYFLHALFAAKLKIVLAEPRLYTVNLHRSTVNIDRRDDGIRIVDVLAKTVSRCDGTKIRRGDDVGCGYTWIMLADISRMCGRLITVLSAVRVALEVIDVD